MIIILLEIVALLSLLFFFVLNSYSSKGFNFFSPRIAVAIGCVAYALPVPFDIVFFGNTWNIPVQTAGEALFLEVEFFLAFIITLSILGRIKRNSSFNLDKTHLTKLEGNKWFLKHGFSVSVAMMIFGTLLYILFLKMTGWSIMFSNQGTRANIFLVSRGLGFLSIGGYIISGGYNLMIAQAGIRKRKFNSIFLWTVLIIFVMVVNILRGNRLLPLIMVIGALSSYNLFFKRIPVKIVGFFGVCGFVVMQTFGFVRGYLSTSGITSLIHYMSSSFSMKWLNPALGELSYSFRIIVKLISFSKQGINTIFPTYIFLPLSFIPKFIFTFRSLTFNEWYAFTIDPTYFKMGGGFGGSLIGESLVNLGLFGPFVIGVAVGMFVHLLEKRCSSDRSEVTWKFLHVSTIPFFLILPRLVVLDFVRYVLFGYLLPFLIFGKLAELIYKVGGKRHGAEKF